MALSPPSGDYKNMELCDIYYTSKARTYNFFPDGFRHYDDNSIDYNPDSCDLKTHQGMFVCSRCSKQSMYINDSDDGQMCSSCMASTGYRADCDRCCKQLGCATCGGTATKMVLIEDGRTNSIVVCHQDKCLMPFGKCASIESIPCTCALDTLIEMCLNLPKVLHGLMSDYIGPNVIPLTPIPRTVRLCDNTWNRKSCLHCHMKSKYNPVDKTCAVKSRYYMCACY